MLDKLAYHPPSIYVTDLLNLCKYFLIHNQIILNGLIQYKKIGEVTWKVQKTIMFYKNVSTL